jgi:phage shock protein PspC (stress-responsive transcriptional regulator)
MNKTATVNIGGMVFHIEELAYEKMKKYLEAIRGYFTTSEGRDEIIQDIESRMAEMFSERLGTIRQVVTDEDVEVVINKMGRPEQVAGEDDDDKAKAKAEGRIPYTSAERSTYRRLYRDPDNKVVGGVCSGFSHYLGTDPIWLRIIFVASIFISFGTTLLVYLILVVIIPKAQTPAEKLEMRGQPVNISTIKKTIDEEVDDIRSRMNDNSFRSSGSRSAVSNFFEGLGEIFLAFIKFVGKAFVFIFLLIAFVILIAVFMGAITVAGFGNFSDIPEGAISFLLTSSQRWLVIISAILLVGVPALLLLYTLIKLIFNIKTENRYLNMGAGILTGIGLIFGIYTAANISKEFRVKESARQNIPLAQPSGNTLYLDLLEGDPYRDESYYDKDWNINGDDWSIDNYSDDTLFINNVKVDVVRASGTEFELLQIATSRGSDRKMAMTHARRLNYQVVQQDSLLKVSKNYQLTKGDRFRGQKVQMVLKVPVGKSVYFSKFMDGTIYDIKNVTNTWDGDMVGKTWTMTERGLECIGCNLEETNSDNDEKVNIKINGKSVSVDSGNDTINWDNKDVKIRINGDGVVIDAKDKRK